MASLIQRAEEYWFAPWRTVMRDALDVIKTSNTMSPTKIALAMADRVMIARGRFSRKDVIPWGFYAVVAFHVLCVACTLMYPFFTMSRDFDGWFFVVLGLVYLHWLVCYGECILSWAEKKLYYDEYNIGDAPLHLWLMDAMPLPSLVALLCLFVIVSWVGIALVVLRNLKLHSGEIGISLKFARR
jgi:hypothetical protein